MKTMHALRTALTAALLHAVGALAEPIDETRDVDADAMIDIEVMNAIVTITGWDENRFHVVGDISDRADGYELREVGGGIHFREDMDRNGRWNGCGWGWGRSNDDDCNGSRTVIEIKVPRNSRLSLEGVNAQVTAEGLYGSTDIETVNGEVVITDLRGSVNVETTNGDIDARELNGRVTLETVNGTIDDDGSEGPRIALATTNGDINSNTASPRITVESTNGDIELEAVTLDQLEASTVNGRLEVDATMNEQAQIDISSVGGRIELTLPTTTSARFDVSTSVGGRITNQLTDDEPERKSRYVNSSELDFTLNDGSGDVDISTVHGNITLRSR